MRTLQYLLFSAATSLLVTPIFAYIDDAYVGVNLGGNIFSKNTSNGFLAELNLGYQVNKSNAFQISGMVGNKQNGWVMLEGLWCIPIDFF